MVKPGGGGHGGGRRPHRGLVLGHLAVVHGEGEALGLHPSASGDHRFEVPGGVGHHGPPRRHVGPGHVLAGLRVHGLQRLEHHHQHLHPELIPVAGTETFDPALLARLLAPLRSEPSRSVLLFDFDGTLSPTVTDPAAARPADGAVDLLLALAERYRTVGVVSGRPASFLEPILPSPPLAPVAPELREL